MMKKSLLVLSALALGSAFSASAEERYYVIKDGVLNEDIVQRPYQPVETEAYDTLVSGQDIDGVAAAAYFHGGDYKDVRFNLSAAPLDLSKTWVMTLKYRLPFAADSTSGEHNTYAALTKCSANDGTKPAFFFGLSADADSMAMNYVDYMFNVQAGYESIENGGEWVTKELYLTVPSFLKEANSLVMGYAREAASADISGEPAYIAELSFHSAGECPFFSEDFSPRMSNVWSNVGKLNDETFEWKGGKKFEVGKKTVQSVRIWNKPWDNSEIPATEAAHAVNLAQSMSYFTILDIELPAGASAINVHSLVKSDVTDKNQAAWDALAETPAERPVSVVAIFDDGTETPVYPEAVRKSQWEWVQTSVAVPAGASKVSLKYISSDCEVALLVNQVMVSEGAIDLSTYFPKAASADVEDNVANTSVALANVYVAGDEVVAAGASEVEVINLNAAVVASAKGEKVNISNLEQGIYVVRVKANGVEAGAVIKK